MRLEKYAGLLSNRDFIERLIARIEELEAESAGKHPESGEQNTRSAAENSKS
jgi:hypothetical protein